MSREARIRIGLLGGRGFGKTVFITKLIQLADNSEDGFLQFVAGSKSLQKKSLMLENGGILPPTEIGEISEYNFVLGKQSGENWRIQFIDYAGEHLEKVNSINEESDTEIQQRDNNDDNNDDDDGNSDSVDDIESRYENYVSDISNKPYIKKMKEWIRKCDAVIVLLPENINDKHIYENKDEITIYCQNVALLMRMMQDDKIIKNRPVCLAVNKWDLAKEGTNFEKVIQKQPFSSLKQTLKNICRENVFCMPISAYGKHDSKDPAKAAPDAKPINVSELLLALAEKAEYSRYRSIKNGVKNLVPVIGWLKLPKLLFSSWKNGATIPRLKRLYNLLYRKYGIISVAEYTGIALLVIFIVIMTEATTLSYQYKNWDRHITEGFNNRESIENMERGLYEPRNLNLLFGKHSIFGINIASLKQRFQQGKEEYNQTIYNLAESLVDDNNDYIHDLNIAASKREGRIDEIKAKLNDLIECLTENAQERMKIQEKLGELELVLKRAGENVEFDNAYQDWFETQDDYQKANKASDFLANYKESDYPDRKERRKEVKEEKDRIEERKYNDLYALLHRVYKNDFDNNTDDYLERIKRAKERINIIKDEEKKIETSHKLGDMENLISQERIRIDYLTKYGPFDLEVQELHALNLNETPDAAIIIRKFIDAKTHDFKDKRSSSLQELEEKNQELNKTIYNNLNESLKSTQWDNADKYDYNQAIKNCKDKILLINNAKERISDSKLCSDCEKMVLKQQEIIAELTKYGPFDIEYKTLIDSPDNNKAIKIQEFFDKYSRKTYDLREAEYIALEEIQKRLKSNINEQIKKRVKPIDKEIDWRVNDAIIQDNIREIENCQKEFPKTSSDYADCLELIRQQNILLNEIRHYGKFDDAYSELKTKVNDKNYIRDIESFLNNYTKKSFRDRAEKIDLLEQECSDLEDEMFKKLDSSRITQEMDWKERVTEYTNHIKDINENIAYLTNNSKYRNQLQHKADELSNTIKKEIKYGEFDDKWKEVFQKAQVSRNHESAVALEDFINEYKEEKYPERKNEIDSAKEELDQLDGEIRSYYISVLNEEYLSNNDNISWETAIERSRRRTEENEVALKNLSTKSAFRKEFEDNIKSETNIVKSIQAFSDYYIEYTNVESENDLCRIPRINSFINKYRSMHVNPLSRYSIDKLVIDRDNLVSKFQSELDQQLKDNQDNPSLSWKDRSQLASNRLNSLTLFQNRTEIDKASEIADESRNVELYNSYDEFENNYSRIMKDKDDSAPLFVLSKIYSFYNQYPSSKWSNLDHYNDIISLENQIIDEINTKFIIPEIKDDSSILDMLNTYRTQKAILLEKIACFPESSKNHEQLNNQLKAVNSNIQRYDLLYNESVEIQRLSKIESSLSEEDEDSIGAFLVAENSFSQKYPNAKTETLFKDEYNRILSCKEKWDNILFKKLNEEIQRIKTGYSELSSDSEKSRVNAQLTDTYDKYLGLMSHSGDNYKLALQQAERHLAESDKFIRSQKIEKLLTQIERILDDNTKDPSAKISETVPLNEAIDPLIGNDSFNRFKDRRLTISNRLKSLAQEQTNNVILTQIRHLLDSPANQDDIDSISSYLYNLDQASDNLKSIQPGNYSNSEYDAVKQRILHTQNLYSSLQRELDLFNMYNTAARIYSQNPNQENIESLYQHKIEFDNFYNQNQFRRVSYYQKVDSDWKQAKAHWDSKNYSDWEKEYFQQLSVAADNCIKTPSFQNKQQLDTAFNTFYNYSMNNPYRTNDLLLLARENYSKASKSYNDALAYSNMISSLTTNLNSSYNGFIAQKDFSSLSAFINVAKECIRNGLSHPLVDYADTITRPVNVNVYLSSFNFEDTGFSSSYGWAVIFEAEILGKGVHFKTDKIRGDNKHNPTDLGNHLETYRTQSMTANYYDNIQLVFKNINGPDDVGSSTKTFAYILASGAYSGSCSISFYSSAIGDSNKKEAFVTLEFSGIPRARR